MLTTEERMTITEIAEQVDVSKGTVHAHLQTLKERGISFKRTTSTTDWDFGSSLSGHTRNITYKRLYRNANLELDKLLEDTGERVQVMMEEAGYGVFLY